MDCLHTALKNHQGHFGFEHQTKQPLCAQLYGHQKRHHRGSFKPEQNDNRGLGQLPLPVIGLAAHNDRF